MEKLQQKLIEIKELIKKAGSPVLPSIKRIKQPKVDTPTAPASPEAPKASQAASKKDPKKVAEQLKDPDIKDQAMKEAKKMKEGVKFSARGQWSIKKTEDPNVDSTIS